MTSLGAVLSRPELQQLGPVASMRDQAAAPDAVGRAAAQTTLGSVAEDLSAVGDKSVDDGATDPSATAGHDRDVPGRVLGHGSEPHLLDLGAQPAIENPELSGGVAALI